MPNMFTIGLMGGIASGKSTVARLLAERGAVVLDADAAAHETLATGEVLDAIRQRWGDDLFDEAGQLERRRLAERVFGPGDDAAAGREFLEGLIHPRVRERLMTQMHELQRAGTKVIVLDIPLLLEAGWASDCDELLLVDSPQSARLARAAGRGWDAEELARREAAQAPIAEKRRRATATVVNDGSEKDLRAAVDDFWRRRVGPRLRAPN